jgi:hypothetical protein
VNEILSRLDRLLMVTRSKANAVGGLIGKSFGPGILQAYLTTDVYEKNYGGHDTRLWGRFIIPSLASFDSAEHTVLQKGVKSFLWIEPGRCIGAESWGDSVRKEQMSCDRPCIPGSSCVPPTRNFPVSIIRQAWNSFAAGRGLRQYQVSSGAVAWYVPKASITRGGA